MGPLMKTPLGKVRGLGAARSGTEHFWLSRVTSIAEIPLEIAAIVIVVMLIGAEYNDAVAIIGSPVTAVILLLWLLNATIHMRLGMQVIIEDYVHAELVKLLALMANTFFTVAVGLAGAYAILRISFGM
jgi:succinate dehydrogenase / fumarate reductase membrane anchor subunit